MPYLSSTIFIVVLVLALLLALTGYFLLARALFPGLVGRAERAWTDRPVVSFGLGIPVMGLLVLVSVGLINAPNPILRVVGFPISACALGFTFAGTAGLACRIGQGLTSPNDAGREWSRLLRAGIVLELSMLFPILGWFLIMPIAVIGGAGAATLALFSRKAASNVVPNFIADPRIPNVGPPHMGMAHAEGARAQGPAAQ